MYSSLVFAMIPYPWYTSLDTSVQDSACNKAGHEVHEHARQIQRRLGTGFVTGGGGGGVLTPKGPVGPPPRLTIARLSALRALLA